MPTKTWEPPPRQRDTESWAVAGRSDEPRNIETPPRDRGLNPDAAPDRDCSRADDEDINFHGSER
jgi:hypothetical protein